jgi:hypothetical protein
MRGAAKTQGFKEAQSLGVSWCFSGCILDEMVK